MGGTCGNKEGYLNWAHMLPRSRDIREGGKLWRVIFLENMVYHLCNVMYSSILQIILRDWNS